MNIKRVCAYTRVSTSKDDQKNSLINQESFFNRYISENKEYLFMGIYADPGLTGTKLNNRPEFLRMLYNAGLDIVQVTNDDNDKRKNKIKHTFIASTSREPKFDLILIKSTSRFARNIEAVTIIRELKKKSVYVQFLDRDVCTDREKDNEYIEQMLLDDQKESSTKSRIVKWGHEEGARRGIIHTNSKIFGYSFFREANRLEINEDEAQIVRKIFELYSQGKGIRAIIQFLTENECYSKAGKPFVKTTISRILTNEKYAGLNNRNKYDTGELFNKNSYPKAKNEGEYRLEPSNKIPAIISRELFESCQVMRKGKVNYQNQKGIYKGSTDYAGLVICGHCGSTYNSNVDKKNKTNPHFYNCSLKKRKGSFYCSNPNVTLAKLDNAITYECDEGYKEFIESLKESNIDVFENLKRYIESQIDTDKSKQVVGLQKELLGLQEQKKKLAKLYVMGDIDESTLAELNTEIVDNTKRVEREIFEKSKGNSELLQDLADIDNSIDEIKKIQIKDKYEKAEMLNLINKIYVDAHGELTITFRISKAISAIANKYEIDIEFFEKYYGDVIDGVYGDETEV
ncbi:MAG: hypothetical protein K0Q65_1064 [Clostridia bacterium]|jgi:DNA invertase Pin-like site-specific DNA recombinase|nr:hypothetical protein [Clostridia bacterium]